MNNALLVVDDIRKRFGRLDALRGVSISVAEGELFGLLGPNGAGKTTLISILSCLLAPSAGTASLDGTPLRMGDPEVRRQIGLVPQDLAIYGELTARENLLFFGRLYDLPKSELQTRVEEVLTTIGLDDRANDRLSNTGATIIYTSHYMEEVQALCSRVGILDNGLLIACDTVPHLLQKLEG